MTGLGFNTLVPIRKQYQCVYTGVNTTNQTLIITTLLINATNLTTLNCGLAPSGYFLNQDVGKANLTIFEVDVLNASNIYQVQPAISASPTFNYNACFNHVKDGNETGRKCGIIPLDYM